MVIVMRKLIYGVGINDADYEVCKTVSGRRTYCQFHRKWRKMLQRCYSEELKAMRPTYVGCSVCDEWLTFSNFKSWMESQDWEGKELDKDLLVVGNKIYSPETCLFVHHSINKFTTDRVLHRGDWPLGVKFNKRNSRFEAQCSNPFKKKDRYIGLFRCPYDAHLAWKARKHEIACQLADLQSDHRVAEALRARYL